MTAGVMTSYAHVHEQMLSAMRMLLWGDSQQAETGEWYSWVVMRENF